MDHGDLKLVGDERLQSFLPFRIHEIGAEQQRTGQARAAGIAPADSAEVRRPPGSEILKKAKERQCSTARPLRRHAHLALLPEGTQRNPIQVSERYVAYRARDALGVAQFVGIAPVHRSARVEQQMDRQLLLGHEELQKELLGASIKIPVDLPKVISRDVGPEV